MKKLFTIFISAVFLTNVSAQTDVRELGDFSSLKVSSAIEVVLTQGDENRAIIAGSSLESIAKVKTEISNGQLYLFIERKVVTKTKGKRKKTKTVSKNNTVNNIKIRLSYKNLNQIELSGASEIRTTDTIQTQNFSITGSGATDISIALETDDLIINFSGASEIKLIGKADNFKVNMSGASGLRASGFITKNVILDISGASDVNVNATESIKGRVSGASDVHIKGNPAIREINKSGASSTGYGNRNTSYNGSDNFSIKVGKQYIEVEEDDVDIKLGNKHVVVEGDGDGDTTTITWGITKVYVVGDSVWVEREDKPRRSHWAGIDLAINGFLNANNSTDLSNDPLTNPNELTQFMELDYNKSWSFSLNFMEFFIPIKKHHFGIVTGLGTEWNNYELKHNVKLNPQGGNHIYPNVNEYNEDYTWGEVDTILEYSKNRFKTWFINAPLLLEVNTGNHKNRSFHISAGAIFGFNLQAKMKYKYRYEGDNKKEKDKQSFNTNPFRVSLTTRIGIGWFNVFATYSLTPLFENDRGPELYPFTVGVTLLGF
ncbi:MAG: hypothetical protein COA97_09065 [Flavobacteriales bacterium]|nr:MAG: hypothetical protein COA97_09065 [Flavobacteriales bacterium]